MKTGIISNEKYSPIRIQRIRNLLEAAADKGNPRFFEIYVDDLKVVEKTSDMECFDEYKMFMDDDTRMLRIQLYTASYDSPRNDKFIFSLNEQPKEHKKEELNGLEVENRINSAIEKERTRSENQSLHKELEETKEKLDSAEEYISRLENGLDELKDNYQALQKKKTSLSEMNAGAMLGHATEYIVKNYPGITKKIPVLSTLSGFLTNGETDLAALGDTPETTEGNASFARKGGNSETQTGLDALTLQKLSFFTDMEAAFTKEQLNQVLEIVKALTIYPSEIEAVHTAFYKQADKNVA
jgi:DNA gyrase/topoisomerase IV subunit A